MLNIGGNNHQFRVGHYTVKTLGAIKFFLNIIMEHISYDYEQ